MICLEGFVMSRFFPLRILTGDGGLKLVNFVQADFLYRLIYTA
jgi:hypothetical protein